MSVDTSMLCGADKDTKVVTLTVDLAQVLAVFQERLQAAHWLLEERPAWGQTPLPAHQLLLQSPDLHISSKHVPMQVTQTAIPQSGIPPVNPESMP